MIRDLMMKQEGWNLPALPNQQIIEIPNCYVIFTFSSIFAPLNLKKMNAIVEIAGQQFKVAKGQELFVHRLEGKEGDKVSFDKVLLKEDGGKVIVGKPTVDKSKVTATILSHVKGDTVIVFKKKRRKAYQKRNGHRQQFTKISIESIS
jgi:large subunit ribosomal protein L21